MANTSEQRALEDLLLRPSSRSNRYSRRRRRDNFGPRRGMAHYRVRSNFRPQRPSPPSSPSPPPPPPPRSPSPPPPPPRYYSENHVRGMVRSAYIPTFAESRPTNKIGASVQEHRDVYYREEVRAKGKEEMTEAELEVIEMMKNARTKEDAVDITRKVAERVGRHLVYLLGKVTEKLSSMVDQGLTQPGIGDGRFRTIKRAHKMFLLCFKKQADRLVETAVRLNFVHPELMASSLLVVSWICCVKLD